MEAIMSRCVIPWLTNLDRPVGSRACVSAGGMIVFFFQAEDGIRDLTVTGVQTCALPIFSIFHVISGEEQDIPILHGRLDGDKVRVLLRSLVPAARVDHVFICGPLGMSEIGRASCRERV